MKHASLFTGIGGFDLAAEWVGWENIFQVEKDDYCTKVLTKNFPNVRRYKDIKEFNGGPYAGAIDVISGGFPCQPFSVAGEQRGTEDDRYLWPEMFRVIREIHPPYVLCENVFGIIKMELDNVLDDLESEAYTTQTFIIPASGVGAWHKRERVWVIGYADHFRRNFTKNREINNKRHDRPQERTQEILELKGSGGILHDVPNSISKGRTDGIHGQQEEIQTNQHRNCCKKFDKTDWSIEPGICRVVDGIPNRVDRIKCLGNAIVPQIAFEIFKAINLHNERKAYKIHGSN